LFPKHCLIAGLLVQRLLVQGGQFWDQKRCCAVSSSGSELRVCMQEQPVLVVPAAIPNGFVIGKLAQEGSRFARQRTGAKILILQ
jgi:hypothetical protein